MTNLTLMAGRYRLLKEIGKGGFGRVYLAEDKRTGERWAIKELETLSSQAEAQRVQQFFDQEQKILSWLNHGSIVRRHEVFTEGSKVYLVMEYVEGVTLQALIAGRPGPLRQDAAVELCEQVADILHYLHTQKPHPIIFRDLKPGNLMVTPEGSVKLIDFGIARLYGRDQSHTVMEYEARHPEDEEETDKLVVANGSATLFLGKNQDTYCLGTPGYAAPEQYPGSGRQTDARTDLYALGVILHLMLTREDPRLLKTPLPAPRGYNGAVDVQLDKLVVRATSLRPEDRFDSARSLARELKSVRESRLRATVERAREALSSMVCTHMGIAPQFCMATAMIAAVSHSEQVKKELRKPAPTVAPPRRPDPRRPYKLGALLLVVIFLATAFSVQRQISIRNQEKPTPTIVQEMQLNSPQFRLYAREYDTGTVRVNVSGPGGPCEATLTAEQYHKLRNDLSSGVVNADTRRNLSLSPGDDRIIAALRQFPALEPAVQQP